MNVTNRMTDHLEQGQWFCGESIARWVGWFLLVFAVGVSVVGCKDSKCIEDTQCAGGTYCEVLSGQCSSDCQGDKDCKTDQVCDTSRGRCMSKSKTCLPQRNKSCVGQQVYWMDSCGNLETLIEDCGQSGCLDGACKTSVRLCGNGKCDIGQEDCQSCATDCACETGQICEAGVCKTPDACGDGKCDKAIEDCTSCPKDCLCEAGKACISGQCEDKKTCGNGICDTQEGENCLTCSRDCACTTGQICIGSGTCQEACGNRTCDTSIGENCSTCAQDCACNTGQRCQQGRCEVLCGNGTCDSTYGENCSTCAQDCACAQGQACNNGSCGNDCGNGTCDATKGENCSTCAQDCACSASEQCQSGKCASLCGNGTCDATKGENCSTCAKDCACPSGMKCENGQCQSPCGDNVCNDAVGENCSTCAKDCACPSGQRCEQGKCSCVKDCTGKSCGDDGCGGSCGTCSGRTTCDTKGQCVCNHACNEGEASCVDSKTAERCELDASGCRTLRNTKCLGSSTCTNGSCCASSCTGLQCGPDGCGGNCGTCPQRTNCQSGKCVCQNECNALGEKSCLNDTTYKECLKDASGCLYWSTSRSCSAGVKCVNNQCCQPQCSGRECGSDGCGGSCGTCANACINNLCRRTLITVSIYLPCSACDDKPALWGADPDPYLKLTLQNATTHKSGTKDDTCNKTITFNWTVTNLDATLLKNAKLEIYDEDSLNSDDRCATVIGDLSVPGTKTLTDTASGAKFTIEVKKE